MHPRSCASSYWVPLAEPPIPEAKYTLAWMIRSRAYPVHWEDYWRTIETLTKFRWPAEVARIRHYLSPNSFTAIFTKLRKNLFACG